MRIARVGRIVLASSALGMLAACVSSYRPPFTASGATARADAHDATVVFLWPTTSCDPGGYYTLATFDGHFVGNIATGTQLRVALPAGEHTILGWNQAQDEARGEVVPASVGVLRASLAEGRTYYVRVSFGEWDARGPNELVGRGHSLCVAPDKSMTSALVTVTPVSDAWLDLPAWTADLASLSPDRAAGQAWLDAHRGDLAVRRAIAEGRFEWLRPRAKKLATVEAGDGQPAPHAP